MKTIPVKVAVLAAVAAFTMVGSAFAGPALTAKGMTPDPNAWEYRETIETGNLPAGSDDVKVASGSAMEVPTVEYGGIVYRIGIDTP